MKYLKFKNLAPAPMLKEFFNVGEGPAHDMDVTSGTSPTNRPILFSIREQEGQHWLLPGDEKIKLDGVTIYDAIVLPDCSRIAWPRGEALFIDLPSSALKNEAASPNTLPGMLEALAKLSVDAESPKVIEAAVVEALQALCETVGAEEASLLCENTEKSEWTVVATVGEVETSKTRHELRQDLVSHTLLDMALKTGEPVFIESIVGHPLEQQASILHAQIFSCACLPLTVAGARPVGAIFLSTHSPRKILDKSMMPAAQLVATHAALFLNAARRGLKQNSNRTPENTSGLGALRFRKGTGHPMAVVAERIKKLAPHDLSVLIRGETGTGKEVVAREIHRLSNRGNKPFIALNCAAIPPSLLESMLFGHTKGAFTGATKDREGKVVQADGGTLFLDEIGDLSPDLQTKLLRVLQEREVEPVGSDVPVAVDIRILSATHQNLEDRVTDESFRKDLYYRLNGASVLLPTLKERGPEEVRLLALAFLERVSPQLTFSSDAMAALEKHTWPGNVRELEQVVTRAAALSVGNEIIDNDLELEIVVDLAVEAATDGSLKEEQDRFTKEKAHKALEANGGNRIKAARSLGISERTFYRILAADKMGSGSMGDAR